MHTARLLINRLLGRETTLDVTLLEQPVRFSIEARREIRRVFGVDEEAELIQQMRPELEATDVVYDIGANIGVISLLTALYKDGLIDAVHSFEPEPRNFAQLTRNIVLNGQSAKITAHEYRKNKPPITSKPTHKNTYNQNTFTVRRLPIFHPPTV